MQRRKKIYLAVELTSQLQKRLAASIAPLEKLPVKWVKPQNYHITVAFLGWVDEEQVPVICAAARAAAERTEMFDLDLDKIELGPDRATPSLIWASGQASPEMLQLVENLSEEMEGQHLARKKFVPHITLGRIRTSKWKELEQVPDIEAKLKMVVEVASLVVVESVAEKGGTTYYPLEECPLA